MAEVMYVNPDGSGNNIVLPDYDEIEGAICSCLKRKSNGDIHQLAMSIHEHLGHYQADRSWYESSTGPDAPHDRRRCREIAVFAQKIQDRAAELGRRRKQAVYESYALNNPPENDDFFFTPTPDALADEDLESLKRLGAAYGDAAQIDLSKGRESHRAEVILLARVGKAAMQHGVLKKLGTSRTSQFYRVCRKVLALANAHAIFIDDVVKYSVDAAYRK